MRVTGSISEENPLYRAFLDNLKPHEREIWDCMIATGLRITDALNLTYSDCEKGEVREKKTGKLHSFSYDPPPKAKGAKSDFVFENPATGKPYARETISRMLSRAGRDTGLPVAISAHSARRMYALRIFHETEDIRAVQAALGHNYLSTTLLYIFGGPYVDSAGRRCSP